MARIVAAGTGLRIQRDTVSWRFGLRPCPGRDASDPFPLMRQSGSNAMPLRR